MRRLRIRVGRARLQGGGTHLWGRGLHHKPSTKGLLKLCLRHPGAAWHLAALRLGVEVRLSLAAALGAVPGRALALGQRLCGLAPALLGLCSVQVLPVLLRSLLVEAPASCSAIAMACLG